MRSCNLVLFALSMCPVGLIAQAEALHPTASSVEVDGQGLVYVQPDRALVRIGIESEMGTAAEAQAETNRIAQAILDSLRVLGVADESIQTSGVGLYPIIRYPGDEEADPGPRVIYYRATNGLTVEVADLALLGPVVDATIGAGGNRIDGIDFTLDDRSAARSQALTAAVEDGRAKAETIALALGIALGEVIEVIEVGVSAPRATLERAEMSMVRDAGTPIATGRIPVIATLKIRYRLGGEG